MNNMKNIQLNSFSGTKKKMNIDNNLDEDDIDDKSNNYPTFQNNSNYNNNVEQRKKKYNLTRSNREKPIEKKSNMKMVPNNNINFKKMNSDQINTNPSFGVNNYSSNNYIQDNMKRSFSGQKNYKPINNLYNFQDEKNYNHINRITTSYNSKLNSKNRNIASNYPPSDNNNMKVMKISKKPSNEINNIFYPSYNNIDNRNNYFNNSFNPAFNNPTFNNNRNLNNFNPNQTQNYNPNSNNLIGLNKIPSNNIQNPIVNNNNYNSLKPMNINVVQPMNPLNNGNIKYTDYNIPRANNTFGYSSYTTPNTINKYQSGILNQNNLPFSMANTNTRNDDDDDGRFHEIKNFSRFSRPIPFNKSQGFDQVLKQQNNIQNNIRDNNEIGCNTFIKKLPPENELNNLKSMNNTNPFKTGISGNQINRNISINNSFGKNINIKKIPSETSNNINDNISQQKANTPINNMIIPNAASFNPNIQNVNKLSNNNNDDDSNMFVPSRNINVNFVPQPKTPNEDNIERNENNIEENENNIEENENNIEENENNVEENENNVEYIGQNENNIEQNENNVEENENNIEQNENNFEENENNIEQNENNIEQNENNIEQNEQKEEEDQNKKDPNISYNEFDCTGLLKNYGGLSRNGTDASGNQKTNQDTLITFTNINNIKDFNIFGVLDGHGPDGHLVSQFASKYIPSQIIQNQEIQYLKDPELIYQKLKENNCQIITEAFLSCDEQLKNEEFDAYGSGSTCILIIHIGQHILSANVGDSRAIVAYDDHKEDQDLNYLEEAQLSIDYKPELEDEKNRILLSGGTVEQMQNEYGEGVGPYRVWVKGQDYPGLAMSRSIGDLKGKTIGVISEPGILEYDINETTKFIILASDGVWEFLSNESVRVIAKDFYLENDTSALCHKIVDSSAAIWQQKDIVCDDITIVVMFF